jgi:DnaK suppressor protein
MNKRDLRHYEDRLTALYDRLTNEVTGMVETVLSTPMAFGEHDHLVSESPKKELVLEGTEEELLGEVVAALRRIEEERFGICERCGHAIARERLAAVPYVPFCIRCERRVEAESALKAVA